MHNYKHYHRVYYNETDQMARVYHANFFLWMEEARTEWFKNIGLNYKEIEADGYMLPVSDINCKYFAPVEYDENVCIRVHVEKITRLKVEFHYEFYNEDENILFAKGTSLNVFTDKDGKPKRVDKSFLERILKGE